MEKDEEIEILILYTPLSTNKEDVFKALNNDQDLIDEIENYKKELKQNNIEIFLEDKNILITENGYYIAVFEDMVTSNLKLEE